MSGKYTVVQGDATNPITKPALIVHCCNDVGAWGAGFVLALDKKWSRPRLTFLSSDKKLGTVSYAEVEKEITVANLIGQRDIRAKGGIPPIRYEAIRDGLRSIAEEIQDTGVDVHMPKMGAGLAGGHWPTIERIVKQELVESGINVYVYEF